MDEFREDVEDHFGSNLQTDLYVFVSGISEPEVPTVTVDSDDGHIITIENQTTCPDGRGGTQTVYRGVLTQRENTLATFELRTGSSLVTVWNLQYGKNMRNAVRIKHGLDWLTHYSDGGARSEYWEFAESRTEAAVTWEVGKDTRDVVEFEDGLSEEVKRRHLLYETMLEFEEYESPVLWRAPNKYTFTDEVDSLSEARPVIEAWERNMPDHRRNAEYKSDM